MRVLVTGASGFVGTALVERLGGEAGWDVRASSRQTRRCRTGDAEWVTSPDLAEQASWSSALEGVDVVVHLAARVHVMAPQDAGAQADFQRVNTAGTLTLAEQASAAGVRRFVYLSSLKVNGEAGAFTEESVPAPVDPYGESKWAAERLLRTVSARTGLEVVIIRPPLVYGPGVKANFQALITAVRRAVPLPLGGIRNLRSLAGVGNLADFIVTCMKHPAAKGETFLVSDGRDLSTPELVRMIGSALGRRPLLPSVPAPWLIHAGRLAGRTSAVERLTGSLTVDISKARQLLGWTPSFTVEDELARTVRQR